MTLRLWTLAAALLALFAGTAIVVAQSNTSASGTGTEATEETQALTPEEILEKLLADLQAAVGTDGLAALLEQAALEHPTLMSEVIAYVKTNFPAMAAEVMATIVNVMSEMEDAVVQAELQTIANENQDIIAQLAEAVQAILPAAGPISQN